MDLLKKAAPKNNFQMKELCSFSIWTTPGFFSLSRKMGRWCLALRGICMSSRVTVGSESRRR